MTLEELKLSHHKEELKFFMTLIRYLIVKEVLFNFFNVRMMLQ